MKKSYKRLICIIMSLFMLLSALPLTVHAATTVINVKTAEQLTAARKEINNGSGGAYTINLTADITGSGIGITNSNAVVTIIGNGHYLSCPTGQNVQAWNGAKVILGDGETELTLVGGVTNDNPGVVYVMGQDSVCIMNDKVTIKDNQTSNYFGGGVTIEGGTFHMYGGTIKNCGIDGGSVCYGGGVAVFDGGTFIMDDGIITDCYIKSDYEDDYDSNRCVTAAGGGVFVTGGSTFIMNGGTISNNTVENTEGMAFGGGVAMVISNSYSDGELTNYGWGNPKSNVVIKDGTITGNEAQCGAGVFVSGYYYAFAGAFGWTPASGITDEPGLFINGGEISENTAEEDGGGIFVAMLRPTAKVQIHNAEIKDNTANTGAGIENFGYWTQMDIDDCTITGNNAAENGGGLLLSSNSSNGYTNLKNTTITGNTSGDRGAGVYYDANSRLNISGADIIQGNTFNDKDNNLNILSLSKPVYVTGDLTGSQIGLSDPTLWDDGLTDIDPTAVSTNYLTSGYKSNNSADPSTLFTSDHESWHADFSDVNENEVRLVRQKPNYHINNADIAGAKYGGEDIFTSYVETAIGKEIKVGETIEEFYTVPEVVPTQENSCPYIFKGWYYDQANDDDSHPVSFGTDKYTKDIYAHWIKVENVAKDEEDDNILPEGETQYGGFDLSGVQVREGVKDTNFGYEKKPGGLRFLTSLSMDVVNEINAIKPDNIEYGYVAATDAGWIGYHKDGNRKLLYVSDSDNPPNGIDTASDKADNKNYFGFAHNVICTSKKTNTNGKVKEDHRNFERYLLYTLVITYENSVASDFDKNVLARPYIRYTDANNLERVAYSEYRGTEVLGGCSTNYNAVNAHQGG